MSIYVRINPDNIARLQPLLNLFFQQAIGLQTREMPEQNPALKHQLLLLLDEFAALGRTPVIADATAFLPGYNVRPPVIVQSHSQLVERYGIEGAQSIPVQADPEAPTSPAPDVDCTEAERPAGSAVPPWVTSKFVKVGNRCCFADRTLAFVDRGNKLKAPAHNREVVRSLLAIAQARNWAAIQVA